MIGETIGGRYEILRPLGEGGMGAVFEARHTGTGRRVALKTIHPGKVKSQQLLARFRIEARAAGSIESEHVVQVFDVDVDETRRMPFLAMEYLSGEDLDAMLDRLGTLPQELALRIGVQTCLGLEKAHAQGILHRDIKPANLIISERDGGERRVKIVDFGLAKALDDSEASDGKSLTVTGMLLGSPQYMSPEQARGQKGLDARTDVWSLGMVLYQALTGRTAFKGVTPIPRLLEAITSQPVASIRETAPWVDVGIASAIERALEIDPAKRHASAHALREALTVFLRDGLTITKDMIVAGPKPTQPAAKVAQNDIATVAKPAPQKEVVAPPIAGAMPIKPTKVSGKATVEGGATAAPATEPLPKIVIPIEVSSEKQALPARAPAGGTLVSGQGPAPTVRGESRALSADPAPPTQRMESPLDAAEHAPALPKTAIPKAPPVAEPTRSSLPVSTILLAGAAAAVLAVAVVWVTRRDVTGVTPAAPERAGAVSVSSAGLTTAAATKTAKISVLPHPLTGKWKTDTGKSLEAVTVGDDIEFRVADLKGFAEQGYLLGERRFTLRPKAGETERFDVIDHVRPLPLTGMAFDESARASCLVEYTNVPGKPLTARLEKGKLIVVSTYMVPAKAMFESTGNRISKCKDLEGSVVSAVDNPLTRVD